MHEIGTHRDLLMECLIYLDSQGFIDGMNIHIMDKGHPHARMHNITYMLFISVDQILAVLCALFRIKHKRAPVFAGFGRPGGVSLSKCIVKRLRLFVQIRLC